MRIYLVFSHVLRIYLVLVMYYVFIYYLLCIVYLTIYVFSHECSLETADPVVDDLGILCESFSDAEVLVHLHEYREWDASRFV